jgi:hypothetical protein
MVTVNTPEELQPDPSSPPDSAIPLPFIDVAHTAWYYPFVRTVWENQLFQGTTHNTFSPQNSMTRGMLVQVLFNLEQVLTGEDPSIYKELSATFADTHPTAWYFTAVEWATMNGFARGIGNDNFAPNRAITREEMAVMLHNYIISRNIITQTQAVPIHFTDQGNISPWAVEGVMAMQTAGLIAGHIGGSFAPNDTATRAEIATIFARLLDEIILPNAN